MSAIDFEHARFNMIEQQVRPWEVLDQRVLDVTGTLPREAFVPERYRNLAYADLNIPLEHGQMMMIPKVEGRLLQALAIQPAENILEVGTGSGYLTACLARLGAAVVSVDIHADFTQSAQRRLQALGFRNLTLRTGNAAQGWGTTQYDIIALTGSLPSLRENWRRQLKLGGRLFVIVGAAPIMEALLITRTGEQEWTTDSLFDTVIPPLISVTRPVEFEF